MTYEMTENGWRLLIKNCVIQALQIDFRLGLLLQDDLGDAWCYVETSCTLDRVGAIIELIPEKALTLQPMLLFLHNRVESVLIEESGALTILFETKVSLKVNPDELYEAWQIQGKGFMFVCLPGGQVALFQ